MNSDLKNQLQWLATELEKLQSVRKQQATHFKDPFQSKTVSLLITELSQKENTIKELESKQNNSKDSHSNHILLQLLARIKSLQDENFQMGRLLFGGESEKRLRMNQILMEELEALEQQLNEKEEFNQHSRSELVKLLE